MGRKKITNYEKIILPNWDKIRDICAHSGATEAAIAEKVGISFASWNNYKKDHPEFDKMVANATIDLVTEVWDELYQASKRHVNKEQTNHIRELVLPDGTIKKTKDVDIAEKVVEPNVEAAKMILRNRDKGYHDRDRTEVELKEARLEIERMKAEKALRDPEAELSELMAEAEKMGK